MVDLETARRPASPEPLVTRPDAVPEIRLCGVISLRKAMGPGYVVGEPYERLRAGEPGEELVRPGYYSDILGATYEALERAEALVGAGTRPEAAAALLHAFAALVSGTVALDLERPGPLLTRARISAGLSKAELARRAGVSRTTVKDVESGRVNPHTGTVARLFAACSDL